LGIDGLGSVVYHSENALNKTNELIQWAGTAFILGMYAVMNLAPTNTVAIQLLALLGAISFFAWTVRVKNRPQQLINTVAIILCVIGLLKHIG
jgi:hypothetical protein